MVSKISSSMTPLQRARLDRRPIYPACPRSGPEQQIDEIFEPAKFVMKELDDNEHIMLLGQTPHPTPIGPGGIQVVGTLPFEECMSQLDDCVAEILSPLLFLRKRKPLSEVVLAENASDLLLESPLKKVRKSPPADSFEEREDGHHIRIRSFQADLWEAKLEELVTFRKKVGHCLVPHNWKENTPLAQWVIRQRKQHNLKVRGEHSTMTVEREKTLEDLGFIWSSHNEDVREERLNEIRDFRKTFGHCNVPSSYAENMRLSIWVKYQRRQYKLFRRGENRSTLTQDRIDKLTDLGFVWNPRNMELGPCSCEGWP
jgi:hypothetical protein